MKREAQPAISVKGQRILDHYAYVLKQGEDLSTITIRNYLSDLRQFIAWCEGCWHEKQDEQSFTPQVISPLLPIRYRTYLQTTLWLKPSSVNRALMSLKCYFSWAVKEQLIGNDPTSTVKFLPKEATSPRHLGNDEEDASVAATNTHGTLRSIGKRKKERSVPLNTTARSVLLKYLETQPQEGIYLFPSEKTGGTLTKRALGHLITKYAKQAQVLDVSPYDLRHRFGYRMAEVVPLHRLTQVMGHDSLDTTMLSIRGTKQDLQQDVERIAWL